MQEHQISSNKIYKLNYNCDLRVKISAQLIDSHTQKTLETENFEAHNHDNVENAFLLENKKKRCIFKFFIGPQNCFLSRNIKIKR